MYIYFIIFLIALIYYCKKKDPEPIFGIYRQRGKWYFLKYLIIRCSLLLRRWKRSKNKKYASSYKEIETDGITIDCRQPLSKLLHAFDAVFFIAASQDGYYILAGSEMRQHGVVNGLFYLVVPRKGILCSLKIPDTVLFGAEENNDYGAEGLVMRPVEPMKKWRVSFEGEMKLYNDPTKRFQVNFDAVWTTKMNYFNFDTDLADHCIAEALALQSWSKEFFEDLEKHHQTHYEQMGVFDGKIIIDGETIKISNIGTFRDHSIGLERNWDLMHRYSFFFIFLEDGTNISIGTVCQPSTCSIFHMGYVCHPSGKVDALEWTDFKLYQHGEQGTPPKDHAFQFKAGKKLYTVQVLVDDEVIHFVGWNWQAKMVERLARFNVNGINGKGVSEFNYTAKGRGRPDYIAVNDPEWFKKLNK